MLKGYDLAYPAVDNQNKEAGKGAGMEFKKRWISGRELIGQGIYTAFELADLCECGDIVGYEPRGMCAYADRELREEIEARGAHSKYVIICEFDELIESIADVIFEKSQID